MTVREYERLRTSERKEDQSAVQLYVQGLVNGLLWASTNVEKERGIGLLCSTDKVTSAEQIFAVLDREIQRKRPSDDAKAALPLSLVVVEAFRRQFPCETGSRIPGTLMPGPRFAQYCNSRSELPAKGICVGFISAVADLLNTVPLYGRRACLPVALKIQDGVTVVQRWIKGHPNDVKDDAREIVVIALSDAYPCVAGPRR